MTFWTDSFFVLFLQGRLVSQGPYSEIKDRGHASLLGSLAHDSEKDSDKVNIEPSSPSSISLKRGQSVIVSNACSWHNSPATVLHARF
jgi:hypothetical protein